MALQFGNTRVGAMQYNGVTIGEAMMNGQIVYKSGPPVVTITATGPAQAQTQVRQACIDHGTTYDTVQALPFTIDASASTNVSYMFADFSSLTVAPEIQLGAARNMRAMFIGCQSLAEGPQLDASTATSIGDMFRGCSSLAYVPDMHTASATTASYTFYGCASLTDGNVRLIGKHPSVNTYEMIAGSGLTREPFYDTNGNPI